MGASDNKDENKALASKLIQEAYELLSETIAATIASDKRAKAQAVDWTDRHRLHVLLEAAEDTIQSPPKTLMAPWFLAELKATLGVISRWQKRPGWPDINESLKNSTTFAHTIVMLHFAEHLEKDGHAVEIVPRGSNSTPDLKLQTSGNPILIECYQPSMLSGQPSDIPSDKAQRIVKKSMEKARHQLGAKIPGILAICGYNQSSNSIETLKQAVKTRLWKTSRTDLWGIGLVMLGVLYRLESHKDTQTFTPIINVHYIENPSYFGRVDIQHDVPSSRPDLVKTPMSDITTDLLIHGDIELAHRARTNTAATGKEKGPHPEMRRLNIIEKPEPLSRSIIHGKSDKVPPLFIGKGKVNCHCGQCGALLGKHIWDASISNIVVECPICYSHNEFPSLPNADYDTVTLTKGNFNISSAVLLVPGKRLEGS